jgi:Domain of unknown function (DUF4338)
MPEPFRRPSPDQQHLLESLEVRLVEQAELARVQDLLSRHHYLGALQAVGERLFYVAQVGAQWLALLCFHAAAKHLRPRDAWIGWTPEQRRRRLTLVANNARFLILPEVACPNLASRTLRLCLDRLSADWQQRYGHPILAVETFVDPQLFCGTTYTCAGWQELGATAGFGRGGRDYYVAHDRPKRLFVRALQRRACRTLQAEHLPPALAPVEAKVAPLCTRPSRELRSLRAHFQSVPEFRGRIESYPLSSLLAIVACAHLAGAPRGHRDLEALARRLTQAQRRALGIRQNRAGVYPAPSRSTFGVLLRGVAWAAVEAAVLAFQEQVRGPASPAELIVLDGKHARASRGAQIVTAATAQSQRYLGSALVEEKSNEIPAARQLLERLELAGRFVSLDALHTQQETARLVVQEGGGDYLLTIKDNQPGLRARLEKLVPAPGAFPPSGRDDEHRGPTRHDRDGHVGANPRTQ